MENHHTIKRGSVALVLLLAAAICGGRAWGISWGEVDQANAYPNVGAVVLIPPVMGAPTALASCTLIHPRVLLTAGHVAMMTQYLPWTIPYTYVSFAPNSLDPNSWLEIEGAYAHPSFAGKAGAQQGVCDVGVIILKKPVYNVPLAPLPYAGFLDDLKQAKMLFEPSEGGVPLRVVGYGTTLEWPPKVVIPDDGWRRFTDSGLLNVQQGWLRLHQNPEAGNGGIGAGDSGGPVFWVAEDGTRTVVAVTSYSISDLGASSHWRVDIPESLEFIKQVLEAVGD